MNLWDRVADRYSGGGKPLRITTAQVWVALWFEAGCDSRRRYHL